MLTGRAEKLLCGLDVAPFDLTTQSQLIAPFVKRIRNFRRQGGGRLGSTCCQFRREACRDGSQLGLSLERLRMYFARTGQQSPGVVKS